jgi:hypothetical protein
MDRRSPLFRFDPGWLWIAAGLVIVFVATVIPAQRALEEDRADLRRLQTAERRVYRLLEAHDRFLADLRDGNESLLRRLAAANLNRMPEGDKAVMLADSIDRHPIAWIEAAVPVEPEPSPAGGRSLLELLVSGQGGLWMTGAGILCLFVGLMLGPGPLVPRVTGADEGSPESSDEATAEESDSEPNSTGEAAEERTRWAPLAATAMAAHGAVSASPDSADGDMTVAPLLWEPENAGSEAESDEDVEDESEADLEAEADEDGELEDAVEEDDDAEPEDEIEEELEDESDEDAEDESEADLEAEADEDVELEDAVEEDDDAELEDEIEEELEDAVEEDVEDESEAGVEAEADEDGELADAVEEDDDAEPEDEIEEELEGEVDENAEPADEREDELEDESDEDVEDESEAGVEAEADDDGDLEDEAEELEDETRDPEIEVRDFSIDRSECDEFSREAWESSEFDVGDRR